jgi:hypothetical protein
MPEVNSPQTPPASPAAPPSLGALLDDLDGLDRLGLITRLWADQPRRGARAGGGRVKARRSLLIQVSMTRSLSVK